MNKKFFNTTFAPSMAPDGLVSFRTLSLEEAIQWLQEGFENVANPNHANTLQALSLKTGIEGLKEAKGGKVSLQPGDQVLVAQVNGLPRETREFTDEEVAKATFEFRLIRVVKF